MQQGFPKAKAVIWDMDGLIFDTERMRVDAWEQVCKNHGYAFDRSVLLGCIGKNVPDSDALIREGFGKDFPVEKFRIEKNALVAAEIQKSGLPVKEGIREALEWLDTRGVRSALASSSERETILSFLEKAALTTSFSVIVGGDDVKRGKPHPDVFLTAAEKLGVPPAQCIVFEDSLNGLKAGHAAGMQVVMIPDLIEPTTETSQYLHHQLKSGNEAPALLATLLGLKE